jgi:hypothetical protein
LAKHPVIGVVDAGASAMLDGCVEGSKWCVVSHGDGEGWVYSDYLIGDFGGQQIVLTERPADSIKVIAPPSGDGGATGAVMGGTTGAVAGAIIGGPIGAAIGGVAGVAIGGTAGAMAEPSSEVRTYVTSNQVDPIYLDGEVVVGAGLPETVKLREIPDYEYRYVYLNGQPVLVEPDSRKIVYVLR